jgi:hypothetical protein
MVINHSILSLTLKCQRFKSNLRLFFGTILHNITRVMTLVYCYITQNVSTTEVAINNIGKMFNNIDLGVMS